jgi:3-hydroxyisobutyrate dehydrogenase/putative dehydrogenase
MATRLVHEDHQVVGYDVDAARLAEAAYAGIGTAKSAALAASGAELLAVMVATPQQVQECLFDSGAVDELAPGTHVVLMATVGPDPVDAWDEALSARGIHLVDAPVSGGVARAVLGKLVIMASGPPSAVESVRPILSIVGQEVAVVGANPGDGQRVKLVNQLLCGVHIAVAAEALAFAEALGLDARACWEVIRHGAAGSFMLDDRGPRMLQGSSEVRSALDIFVKDMGLVVKAANDREFSSPLARLAEQLYLAGSSAGLGGSDDSAIIEVIRGRGIKLT